MRSFFMVEGEHYIIGAVTDRTYKAKAVSLALPDATVVRVNPLVDEKIIAQGLPKGSIRSFDVSHTKAATDIAEVQRKIAERKPIDSFEANLMHWWWQMHGLSDTAPRNGYGYWNDIVNFVPNSAQDPNENQIKNIGGSVYERPENINDWKNQLEEQRNRPVWLSAANTVTHLRTKRPVTTGVITRVYTRNYTENDIYQVAVHIGLARIREVIPDYEIGSTKERELAKKVGIGFMKKAAGGMPFRYATELFDPEKPLTVFYYPNKNSRGIEIFNLDKWTHLTSDDLLPYITGAFPIPLLATIHMAKDQGRRPRYSLPQ